jgi:hypothetical protein
MKSNCIRARFSLLEFPHSKICKYNLRRTRTHVGIFHETENEHSFCLTLQKSLALLQLFTSYRDKIKMRIQYRSKYRKRDKL